METYQNIKIVHCVSISIRKCTLAMQETIQPILALYINIIFFLLLITIILYPLLLSQKCCMVFSSSIYTADNFFTL